MNSGPSPSLRTGRSATARRQIAAVFAAGVTRPPAPRPRWLRRGRIDLVAVADVIVALICFASTDSKLTNQHPPHATPGVILVLSLALCAPLVVRTYLPLTAFCASAAGLFWVGGAFSAMGPLPGPILVYILCLYAVSVRCESWVVVTAGVVTVLGGMVIYGQPVTEAVLTAAVPILAGVVVRTRRGSTELLAVQERRHEGERALLEERQRIARELHDVVAHHMSVIAIQAEAGPYKVQDPPKELVESFAEIRASALSGLKELRRVLGVLRSDTPDTAPQPGLDDLEELLESARSAGVTVTAGVSGTARPLPAGVDLSAYRIIQEALSNAMRHAPGAAVQVKLYYGDAALVVEVRNDHCPPGTPAPGEPDRVPADGGGHGIIGMRERATMLGGHLQAGPTEKGEFLVTAALPLDSGSAQDAS
ncbi:MAG TPA: histidine kinase [Streptosporangiaceae bacterium]|nr:histidine kinase [Streptosporangiaceae bacterium]